MGEDTESLFQAQYGHLMPNVGHVQQQLSRWGQPSWRRFELRSYGKPPGAIVYLHDPNCPFLRFMVVHPTAKTLPCLTCGGEGRVVRPEWVSPFRLGEPRADTVDDEGKRWCLTCFGKGQVDPYYGSYDAVQRLPLFDRSIPFAPPRSKEDVLYVIRWCDRLYNRLHGTLSDLERLSSTEW
jgi:hypothetical protein